MTAAAMPNETYNWEEAAAALRKRADEGFPSAWIPEEPGDELLGWLRRFQMQAPSAYGPVPVLELERPGGDLVSVWLHHTVLRRAFERERVRLGEFVLIRYEGKTKPEGGGNAYDNYKLVVDRKNVDAEPDWAEVAERYNDETPPMTRRRDEIDLTAGSADDDIPF